MDQETFDELKAVAVREGRSISDQAVRFLRDEIAAYEMKREAENNRRETAQHGCVR